VGFQEQGQQFQRRSFQLKENVEELLGDLLKLEQQYK
jgi:hypothetical protein